MNLYNYDYSDMMDKISFSYNAEEPTELTSKVYPTKLEVNIDEELSRPYLYYEGIVQTNKGAMKIIFPRLDLVLDNCSIEQIRNDDFFFPWHSISPYRGYKITTEFNNIDKDTALFELRYLNDEDCRCINEAYFKR